MARFKKISVKPSKVAGAKKTVSAPRNFVNKKRMQPKGGNTRDYKKSEFEAISQYGDFGFGQTGMSEED